MKYLVALLLLLGCAEPVDPPKPIVLPTYTVEHGEIRMAFSEPGVERSMVLVGAQWLTVKTKANWRDAQGKTATIVRQSDGQSFLTVDGVTGPIED